MRNLAKSITVSIAIAVSCSITSKVMATFCTVSYLTEPAKNIFDLKSKHTEYCDTLSYVSLNQMSNYLHNYCSLCDGEKETFWEPIGMCDYKNDQIFYYTISTPYETNVYACLNPSQKGFPPTLLIIAGFNDPWPSLWFKMENDTFILYSGHWGRNDQGQETMIVDCIERYIIENGTFELIGVQNVSIQFSPFNYDAEMDYRLQLGI